MRPIPFVKFNTYQIISCVPRFDELAEGKFHFLHDIAFEESGAGFNFWLFQRQAANVDFTLLRCAGRV
jgi:hypothetical protein